MTNWLNRLSPALLKIVKAIGEQAQSQDLRVYLIGGVVRDLILKRKNLDLDVVVEGDAISLARSLTSKYKASMVVHEKFGTATLRLPNHIRLDLTTARKEHYPYPAALPVVQSGMIRDDLFRRDFTINAMAVCINPTGFGILVDYYGGWEDLRHKKVRVLHKESFIEDPTRILRAVRIAQRLRFEIEPQTLLLLKSALQKRAESAVKPERYFQEFKKNLKEIQPWKNIERLHGLGGLKFLGKGVKYDRSVERLMLLVYQQIQWHQRKFKAKDLQTWLIYFMALLCEVLKPLRRHLIAKFHLRNYERDNILALDEIKNLVKKLSQKQVLSSDVAALLKPFKRETILFVRTLTISKAVRLKIDKYWSTSENIRLSVDGHDLKRLGLRDGRAVGEVLKKLLKKKIDSEIISRRDELRMAKKIVSLEMKRIRQ